MKIKAFNIVKDKKNSLKKTICILGSARSGTSMVSGLVKIMGINMGNNLDTANNEDRDFHKISQPLKELVNPKHFGHKRKLIEMKYLIESKNTNNDLWGWKDPQSIVYFDKIDKFLVNPHCIMIFRDPLAIAQKEVQSGIHNNIVKTLELVIKPRFNHMLKCLNYIEKKQHPLLLISYERALRQKLDLINTLSSFLNIDLSSERKDFCQNYIKADRNTGKINI